VLRQTGLARLLLLAGCSALEAPAAQQDACVVRWVSVKAAWSPTVDRSEVAALEELLATC
jgi:hypothetical protein